MKDDGLGLTPEEREGLTGQPTIEPQTDFNMSVLAFVCLLLICLLVIGASFIARSQVKGKESGIEGLPSRGASGKAFHIEQNHHSETQEPERLSDRQHRRP